MFSNLWSRTPSLPAHTWQAEQRVKLRRGTTSFLTLQLAIVVLLEKVPRLRATAHLTSDVLACYANTTVAVEAVNLLLCIAPAASPARVATQNAIPLKVPDVSEFEARPVQIADRALQCCS